MLGHTKRWLALVREEHEAPDLWSELEQRRELFTTGDVENTPFAPDERERIAAQLSEVKEYL